MSHCQELMSIVGKYYVIERFQCLSYFAEIKSSMTGRCKLPSYTEFFLILLKQTPYSSDEVRCLFEGGV